jgi:uncharacterized protein YndB with AHSA1/START domain
VTVDSLYAIRKEVRVGVPVERAWTMFAERLGEWWPLDSHSFGGERAVTAVLTPERVYERWDDGTERTWGHVLAWEPPHRLLLTWEIGDDCGREVEIRFLADGDGTRVELEHRGWETGAEQTRESYDGGWSHVLGRFVDSIDREE